MQPLTRSRPRPRFFGTSGPSFALDFVNGTNALDPRVTFTRASTATYFDASGVLQSAANNVPRIDFDPATLLCNGLLIEESRTNLMLQSEDFSTSWAAIRTNVSTNASVAPNGTSTADKLIATSVLGSHLVSQNISVTAQTYTFSCFAKAGGYNFLQLNIPDPGAGGAGKVGSFNVSTGTLGVVQDTGVTRTIQPIGNGWYRCSITFTTTGAGTPQVGLFVTQTDVRAESFTGDDVSGIFIWGAQIEAGAFPTSYIPTTTTALTRAADVASVNTLSPWYNASAGTLFVEASPQVATASSNNLAELSTNISNRIGLYKLQSTGNASLAILDGGSVQASTNSGAWTATGKVAGAYATNDFASSLNGSVPATDTTGTVPAVTTLTLGRRADGANLLNGYLRRIAYYSTRLPDAQLQALTAP